MIFVIFVVIDNYSVFVDKKERSKRHKSGY